MDSLGYFRQLFEYDRWGNHAALASLASIAGPQGKALKVFSHVIGGHRVWWSRFDASIPPNVQPWPALAIEECRSAIEEIFQRWTGLLDHLTEEKLGQDVVYRTTKGVEFRTPIRDVLTHLLMHSAYHRGQVAVAVREAGGKPAPTDYVLYLRQRT